LLIETENSQESDESSVTPIIAINLRLSEIEFADSQGWVTKFGTLKFG